MVPRDDAKCFSPLGPLCGLSMYVDLKYSGKYEPVFQIAIRPLGNTVATAPCRRKRVVCSLMPRLRDGSPAVLQNRAIILVKRKTCLPTAEQQLLRAYHSDKFLRYFAPTVVRQNTGLQVIPLERDWGAIV